MYEDERMHERAHDMTVNSCSCMCRRARFVYAQQTSTNMPAVPARGPAEQKSQSGPLLKTRLRHSTTNLTERTLQLASNYPYATAPTHENAMEDLHGHPPTATRLKSVQLDWHPLRISG
jgi:hypothetical protein